MSDNWDSIFWTPKGLSSTISVALLSKHIQYVSQSHNCSIPHLALMLIMLMEFPKCWCLCHKWIAPSPINSLSPAFFGDSECLPYDAKSQVSTSLHNLFSLGASLPEAAHSVVVSPSCLGSANPQLLSRSPSWYENQYYLGDSYILSSLVASTTALSHSGPQLVC